MYTAQIYTKNYAKKVKDKETRIRTCNSSMNYGAILELNRHGLIVQFHQKP